jgi:dihydroflavonol-4-reductase
VTGASGYLGSNLIKYLIDDGKYHVRGTVRDPNNASKVSHLKSLFPTLELVKSDLLEEGSFDDAVKDCTFVFHTASPFQLRVDDPQRDLVDPAVNGTLNVLRAIERLKDNKVRRVVLTSSVAAIKSQPRAEPYTEKDWNNFSTIKTEPYPFSKTEAEKAAWEFSQGKKWDLVVINPSFILGPTLSNRIDSTSVNVVKAMLEGKMQPMTASFCIIHVSDVAKAHALAAELPSAGGERFCVASYDSLNQADWIQILKDSGLFADYPIDNCKVADPSKCPKWQYDCTKAKNAFKMEFISPKDCLIQMAQSLIDLGVVSKPNKL